MMFHGSESRGDSRGAWKHGAIPVIGLIGGIGSGKSAVAAILAARGAAVIDADRVGHEVLGEPEVTEEIVARFGENVLRRPASGESPEPQIDRAALGSIVFADPRSRRELESIVHPRMRERFRQDIGRLSQQGGARMIVLDAAILLEAGWDDLCDRVVFVEAPADLRRERVAKARGWTAAVLESRERAQWPPENKRLRADIVLVNGAGLDSLNREVGRLEDRLGDLSRLLLTS
jgi:dephospho-CoA kinase